MRLVEATKKKNLVTILIKAQYLAVTIVDQWHQVTGSPFPCIKEVIDLNLTQIYFWL